MKKFLVVFVVLAFSIATVSGIVFAASHVVVSDTFYACENNTTSNVDASTITQNNALVCPKGQSVVSWSVQGPKGDTGSQGPAGVSGYTVVNSGWQHVEPGTIVHVLCPVGEKALGGGADLSSSTASTISHSKPFSNDTGWETAYAGHENAMRVWAECAKVAA